MNAKEGPIWQLEQNAEHYEKSAIAFHADSVRFLQKAEHATALAKEYRDAVAMLQQSADKPQEGE